MKTSGDQPSSPPSVEAVEETQPRVHMETGCSLSSDLSEPVPNKRHMVQKKQGMVQDVNTVNACCLRWCVPMKLEKLQQTPNSNSCLLSGHDKSPKTVPS